jgi:hypothetical protein
MLHRNKNDNCNYCEEIKFLLYTAGPSSTQHTAACLLTPIVKRVYWIYNEFAIIFILIIIIITRLYVDGILVV